MPHSSERFAQPLRLEPAPPLLPLALLLAGHVGALVLLLPLPIPIPIILALAAALGWSGWRTVAMFGSRRISTLVWHPDGRWESGEGEPLTLIPPPFVGGPLVILTFAGNGGRKQNLLLTAASIGREPLRRLRVRLRMATDPDGDRGDRQ